MFPTVAYLAKKTRKDLELIPTTTPKLDRKKENKKVGGHANSHN